ncbi:unnamed protein product, partial [Ectocarpus sp. 8 AP-2014]
RRLGLCRDDRRRGTHSPIEITQGRGRRRRRLVHRRGDVGSGTAVRRAGDEGPRSGLPAAAAAAAAEVEHTPKQEGDPAASASKPEAAEPAGGDAAGEEG